MKPIIFILHNLVLIFTLLLIGRKDNHLEMTELLKMNTKKLKANHSKTKKLRTYSDKGGATQN